jgi:uncharacterized membrane-anchored protein
MPHAARHALLALSLAAALASPGAARPQDDALSAFEALPWTWGPATGELGAWASVEVPEGYRFVESAAARQLLEMMENPTSGSEVGLIAPEDFTWFAVFEFDDSGYVEDDEGDELDAEAILDSLREGNDAANAERKRRGWSALELVGWVTPPRYDARTHNLEWATKGRSDGMLSVNHNTRLLGRRGVMSATLVAAPEDFDAALPPFREMLTGFSYKPGQSYAEYRSGDKVAEYGLTALVAGGAAAAAAKSGLLGKLWKVAVAAVIAVGAFVKRIFGGGSSIFFLGLFIFFLYLLGWEIISSPPRPTARARASSARRPRSRPWTAAASCSWSWRTSTSPTA